MSKEKTNFLSHYIVQELEEQGIIFRDSLSKNLEFCVTASFRDRCEAGRNHKEALSLLLESITDSITEYSNMAEYLRSVLSEESKEEKTTMNESQKLDLIDYQIRRENIRERKERVLDKWNEEIRNLDKEEIEINEKIFEIFSKTDEYKKIEPLVSMDEYYKCIKIKTQLYDNSPTSFDLSLKDGEIVFISATHDYEGYVYTYKEMCEHLYKIAKRSKEYNDKKIETSTEESKKAQYYMEIFKNE